MTDSTSTPDAAAREMITELQVILGSKLVAYLAGMSRTDTLHHWIAGTAPLPDRTVLDRLQVALDAAHIITTRDTPAVAQTWFQGRNPTLNDQPPAQLLREAELGTARDSVLAAAAELSTHSG